MDGIVNRVEFAVLLLASLGVAACGGDEPEPTDETADWIPVRVLSADLLRGGTAVLYPDGRAIVAVMHLGGGTDWRGNWTEDGALTTITLPRRQELTSDWSAPEDLEPPDELILRKVERDAWVETRRTFVHFIDFALPWKLLAINRIPKAALEKDYLFVTEEEWWSENGGGGFVSGEPETAPKSGK